MADKQYIVGNISIKVTKERVYATLPIENYSKNALTEIITSLKILEYAGFKKYDIYHETGYYGEYENPYLEMWEEKSKINLEFLKPKP